MRCYTGQHRFYCGVDLHARTMFTWQRASQVGLQRGGVSDAAELPAGQELDAADGEEEGKKKALSILEAKLGRCVYHLWRKQVPFDRKRFLNGY